MSNYRIKESLPGEKGIWNWRGDVIPTNEGEGRPSGPGLKQKNKDPWMPT